MRKVILLALIALIGLTVSAQAGNLIKQPNLTSFELGYYDFDKTQHLKKSIDFRLEERWGLSLLPLIIPSIRSWDAHVQFHPYLGFETTSRGALYGNGGWDMDWYISRHWVFSWLEGCGFFYRGNGARMGGVFQFRSQGEFGYRFDNNMRVTAQISHISDAKITNLNPGAEIAGIYLHIPTSMIFGK